MVRISLLDEETWGPNERTGSTGGARFSIPGESQGAARVLRIRSGEAEDVTSRFLGLRHVSSTQTALRSR